MNEKKRNAQYSTIGSMIVRFTSVRYILSFGFLILVMGQSFAQSIHIQQLGLDFTSYLFLPEQKHIDSVLNDNEFIISLVSLKPRIDSQGAYPVSVLVGDFDDSVTDSTFFDNYLLQQIQTDLFDSIVPLETSEYALVLSEILLGEIPSEENQLINICYSPRHAIIITNKDDDVLGIFEICFECGKSKVAFFRIETVEGIPGSIYGLFGKYGFTMSN